MIKNTFLLISTVLLLGACAGPASRVDLNAVAPIAPIINEPAPPQTTGSLWTDSRGGMFVDLKGHTVGDIITVVIIENASASKEATTETDRKSTMSAGITNLLGLEKYIGQIGNNAINNTALVNATTENDFTGGGKTERKETLTAT
ncbi:MAG: flagellar basal body L-ring protein FlgH, partial [Thermodesulfobacteriota bacterium]|nr:flagellar basal body L-ring protein FlgH [Thermodesulfobacteriota bacterium]